MAQGPISPKLSSRDPLVEFMSDQTLASASLRSPALLDYEAALMRVMGLADFERSATSPKHAAFHLQRTGSLMERLGNPQDEVPAVHVAGTKGKGSTAAMVASVLTAGGYKVGLYTSPHLHSAVERIRIGLDPIGRHEFAELVDLVWPEVEYVGREAEYGAVTTFEMLTAMAFLHFKRTGADLQVVEVGLGGRRDATNILSPTATAITSISLDHIATLGNTVEKIAYEKAGIIKPDVPVIVAPQPTEAFEVIERVADSKGAPLLSVASQATWRRRSADVSGQSFELQGLRDRYRLTLPLLGDHQLENAATAVATVETLSDQGLQISKKSVADGLRDVRWSARLEVLSAEPRLVIVDGAHNPYSVRLLVQALREHFEFRRVILIFGALGGHSAAGMISELADLSPRVLVARSRHPRSAPSAVISDIVSARGLPVVFQTENVADATRCALEMVGEKDLLLGTGSLSVAAEIIEEIRGIEPEIYPNIKQPADAPANVAM